MKIIYSTIFAFSSFFQSTIIGKMNFFVWCLLSVCLLNHLVDVKGHEIVEIQSTSSDAPVYPDISDKTVRHYKKHYAPKVVPKEVIETETVFHVEKSSSETATLWDNIFNVSVFICDSFKLLNLSLKSDSNRNIKSRQ